MPGKLLFKIVEFNFCFRKNTSLRVACLRIRKSENPTTDEIFYCEYFVIKINDTA